MVDSSWDKSSHDKSHDKLSVTQKGELWFVPPSRVSRPWTHNCHGSLSGPSTLGLAECNTGQTLSCFYQVQHISP